MFNFVVDQSEKIEDDFDKDEEQENRKKIIQNLKKKMLFVAKMFKM